MAAFAALAAWWTRSLSAGGAFAAACLGFIVFGGGGAAGALPLIFFFVSATLLTKLLRRHRPASTPPPAAEGDDSGGRRARQVVANGGVAGLAMTGFVLWSVPIFWVAFAGALATATADTWATELGALSSRSPVLITTGRRVAPGRSGAVSLLGTAGGVAGAFCLALVARAAGVVSGATFVADGGFVAAVAGGGIVGFIADSFLGATVQARYVCPVCGHETEQPGDHCGRQTVLRAGYAPMDNDAVNMWSTCIGAAAAATAALFTM